MYRQTHTADEEIFSYMPTCSKRADRLLLRVSNASLFQNQSLGGAIGSSDHNVQVARAVPGEISRDITLGCDSDCERCVTD